ncbi:MAG: IS630 family transposase [Anaerolineales bacterium]
MERQPAAVTEQLRAGPGLAAAKAQAVGAKCPAPGKWSLLTIRASVQWLKDYSLSGVWRVLQRFELGLRSATVQHFSPDPRYALKQQRMERALRGAVRAPRGTVAVFLDEFGYHRWPDPARDWGQPRATRAGNNPQWRTVGALNALTGQVTYLDGYIVGRKQLIQFYAQLSQAYPRADRSLVIQDNWSIHLHPEVLAALAQLPRLQPVWLPTYAPWLNPIEKLWRWARQDVLKLHRWVTDWERVKQNVRDFLNQFQSGSQDLLRYVGLLGQGRLASVIRNA